MITPAYAVTMARYNRWQNESLYREAWQDSPTRSGDAPRRLLRLDPRHAQSHLLGRLHVAVALRRRRSSTVCERQGIGRRVSQRFDDLAAARPVLDGKIVAWADALTPEAVAQDLVWWSGLQQKNMSRPSGLAIAHIFNHQTHHRGQVHAMLTAAGAKPDDTDVVFMP